jgi:hypothetical protein
MDQKMIEKYNPDKFRELKPEDIEAMRKFTMNDVAELAKAYPNKPSGRAYLVLFNTEDKAKQLYPLSTWQNLLALWKQQLTKYVAYSFAALHNNKTAPGMTAKTGPVQDLTQAEVTKAIKGQKTPVTVPIGQKQTPKPVKSTPVADDESDGDVLGSDADFTEEEFDHMATEAVKKTQPVTRTAAEAEVKKKNERKPGDKKPLTSSQRKKAAEKK